MIEIARIELRSAAIFSPEREARLLVADILNIDVMMIPGVEGVRPSKALESRFRDSVHRRCSGEPVSRICGWREFYGRRFSISPAVHDPRPETELLVTKSLTYLPYQGCVLDLGAGCGAILLSILAERDDVSGVGLDLSAASINVALENANAFGVQDRVEFVEGDWESIDRQFDLIVTNPPFVADSELESLSNEVLSYDPMMALSGGADGLDAYRAILRSAPRFIKQNGWIGLELGWRQSADISVLMDKAGLVDIEFYDDLFGHARVVFGRRPF